VGRTIQLNRNPFRVLGVLPAGFSLRVLDRTFETDVWTVVTDDDKRYSATTPSPVAVIGRLKNGISVNQAEADLSALQSQLNRQFSDEPQGSGILVENLQQDNTRTVRSSPLLLFGAVSVLLVIAAVYTSFFQATAEYSQRPSMRRPSSSICRVVPRWECRRLPQRCIALIQTCRSTTLARRLKSLARCALSRESARPCWEVLRC